MALRSPIRAFLPLVAALLLIACGPEPTTVADGGPGDSGATDDAGTSDPDGGTADDGGAPDGSVPDPCEPNPCTDAAGHRTRCLWDGQGGYECRCEVGYHDSEGLCCPAFSSNVQGTCTCNQGYVPDETGACVVACSEDSIEGLDGWCPSGELCLQGACIEDVCQGVSCPERAGCVMRGGEPFCLCEEGTHLSGELCCPLNATNVDGACTCDAGYVEQGGECVADPSNPCFPQNPCGDAGLHRSTCVADGSAQGYRCECNQGYQEQDGACVLTTWESCPAGLACRADVCVPHDLSDEQCLTSEDCREFYPDAPTTCNAAAAGGICLGCTQASDCPGNTQCTPYNTCALMCDDDTDCAYGRCYTSTGYCGQARCTDDADCAGGTVCIDEDGNGQGLCLRIPCVETACSPTNPSGTCAQPGEACLYGACVASCDPNPCTQELNKTVCTLEGGAPACGCADGYEPDGDGDCVPASAPCEGGLTCTAGVCADATAPGFVCAVDSDCGAGLTCSASLPSGSCSGCSATAPCPEGLDCLAGYCLQPCSSGDDCHAEMSCRGTGYCGRKACSAPEDCAAPYVCVAGADGGTCRRPVCAG